MVNSTRNNRRRTNREDGVRLLFGAAQDVARRTGVLGDGVQATFENSSLERGRFKLRNSQDHLIAAVPVQDARDMLAYRRELAREVMQRAGVEINPRNPTNLERQKLRLQPHEVRALTWAISSGRRVPYRKRQPLAPLYALLTAGLYLLCQSWKQRQYSKQLAALVKRWQQAGRPEPEASFFQLYGS
jgi:hypothetical protein